jgi:hypothetical protein
MSITQQMAHGLIAMGAPDALAAFMAVLALVLVPLMTACSVCGLLERRAARAAALKERDMQQAGSMGRWLK